MASDYRVEELSLLSAGAGCAFALPLTVITSDLMNKKSSQNLSWGDVSKIIEAGVIFAFVFILMLAFVRILREWRTDDRTNLNESQQLDASIFMILVLLFAGPLLGIWAFGFVFIFSIFISFLCIVWWGLYWVDRELSVASDKNQAE
jgi:magnesium-transporting ATPase (P-type)